MILYYMELLPQGAKIYRCQDYDRHKIWVEHPNAKEISRKMAEQIEQLIKYKNESTTK